MRIFVGNLSFQTQSQELESAFGAFGDIESATVITDRVSGRSKGFGFVEMPDDSQAQAAISGMNGNELDGRALTVNEARPREDRSAGGAGGAGGGRRW